MRLPVLCSLSLKDPLYSPSPVSLLCNYSTHVLFHLPNVTKLDTFDVSKTVVEVAEVSSLQTMSCHTIIVKNNLFSIA